MPNNYSRNTYDRHPDKIERNHLCPLCGAYVMPFLGVLGTEHKGHCPKCGTVTYVSMPETVTHEFTSYIRAELEQKKHKALQIVLSVTAPKDDPAMQRLNKSAGYDIVTAICTTSPERKEWEAQYLAKRAAHVEKYWSK